MAKPTKRSRMLLSLAILALIAAALVGAFWPRPALVDLASVSRGPLMVTIDEEGRTQVAEPYIVSTPLAGRIKRLTVHPGDPVIKDETVVVHMLPTNPIALDARTREQAQSAVTAAEAALRVSRADLNAALAGRDFALTELQRAERLTEQEIFSEAALDKARQQYRIARATVETAEAAITMGEASLDNARAQLINFDDKSVTDAIKARGGDSDIPITAPETGRILRVFQESETTLPAGAPILEIGDVEAGLEVVVELISSDAVQVRVGNRVIIGDWGGANDLSGVVARIDPFGITRVSALGVQEQRVPVTISLTSAAKDRVGLGHGYRVEARIVVWDGADVVRVPSSALFREAGSWAVFLHQDGKAILTPVNIGQNNGIMAEVLTGLTADDRVIIYPSAVITDGAAIAERNGATSTP